MSSKVDIANLALDLVGQGGQPIMALTDATPSAQICARNIDQAIREVLRAGKWKPARARAILAQLSAIPAFGWAYQYALPSDYLRMISFNDLDPTNVARYIFTIEGKQLLTNETTVNIVYVSDLTLSGNDINVTDAMMTQCFALNLAAKLCWPLQQSRTLRESLLQEYGMKLKLAIFADAREEFVNPTNRLNESDWLPNRISSTNG